MAVVYLFAALPECQAAEMSRTSSVAQLRKSSAQQSKRRIRQPQPPPLWLSLCVFWLMVLVNG